MATIYEERAVAQAEITRLCLILTEAWNRGDLEQFCSGYAEDAAYLSPSGGAKYGRDAILQHHKSRYLDALTRGRLKIEVIRMWFVEEIGRPILGASLVVKWEISYSERSGTGLSLLVLHLTDSGWQIVQDASF